MIQNFHRKPTVKLTWNTHCSTHMLPPIFWMSWMSNIFLEVWTLRCFYIETKESLMVKSSEKCLETRDKSEESLLSRFVCASVDFQKSEFQPCRRNMCSTQTRNKQTTLPTPRKTNSANWKVSPIFFIGNKKQTRLKKKSRILEFSNESWFGFP